MKSRYCPLLELHAEELVRKKRCACGKFVNHELSYTEPIPGFAKSSSIRYSPSMFKSHRRLDSAIRESDLEAIKMRRHILGRRVACATC